MFRLGLFVFYFNLFCELDMKFGEKNGKQKKKFASLKDTLFFSESREFLVCCSGNYFKELLLRNYSETISFTQRLNVSIKVCNNLSL